MKKKFVQRPYFEPLKFDQIFNGMNKSLKNEKNYKININYSFWGRKVKKKIRWNFHLFQRFVEIVSIPDYQSKTTFKIKSIFKILWISQFNSVKQHVSFRLPTYNLFYAKKNSLQPIFTWTNRSVLYKMWKFWPWFIE